MAKKYDRQASDHSLKITTFGTFTVTIDGRAVSEDSKRQQKIWTLLKFILTNRKRRIPPESFFDVLWSGENCDNPQKALQNLIYRLRLVLAQGDKDRGESYIQFTQGCYVWNPQDPCELDVDVFEKQNSLGLSREQHGDEEGAIEAYLDALKAYQGPYLAENASLPWVIPAANGFKRLYVNIATRVVAHLKNAGRHEDIARVCEAAFLVEPFEEPLHAAFIDALIGMDKPKEARMHYEYITAALYREFGVRPSQILRDSFQRLNEGTASVNMDLDVLQELLAEKQETSEAFFCDPELFRSIYKLEARRAARTGQVVFLVLFTVLTQNYQMPDNRLLKGAMDALCDVLLVHLRRGDVVSRWNDSQYIVMLTSLTYEDGEMVVRRLCDRFNAKHMSSGVLIRHKLQPVSAT